MATPPLAGVRVLDLSRLLPGPFASQILCDLGAEVIKVEDSTMGDYIRFFEPLAADGNSVKFHALNRGKKSVTLDLKDADDRARFMELVKTADVVLESFRPGVMRRLGIAPEVLLKARPGLVVCSISGYGQDGPDAQRAGHDLNYLARAGVLGMMKRPTPLPVQVADVCGGAYPAVVQVLAGLHRARATGEGAVIDVSMADCSLALLAMAVADSRRGTRVGGGRDLLVGAVPCYDVYATKDGHLSVGALEPKFWERFVDLIGEPSLKSGAHAQGAEGERVRQQFAAAIASKTNAEWREMLRNETNCCVEVVESPDGVLDRSDHLRHRALTVPVDVAGEQHAFLKTPLRMTGVTHRTERGPALGEHNGELLSRL